MRDYRKIEMEEDKRTEFAQLFEEFAKTYPVTPSGQRHIKMYESGREQGRKNFEETIAAADRGEDVTKQVLLKMLPYTSSASNRQKGAWIHFAPTVTGNIKGWFEKIEWTKPDDWPRVAQAILHFVRRCNDNPLELQAACEEFASLPLLLRFQTGILTPILNALRPDDFILINNKPRRVINYFADTSYGQQLADYPAINATGHELIEKLAGEMHRFDVPEMRATDLFDMFSHWLVAVKKFDFRTIRYWKIAPGKKAWNWDACREGGFIAIGWDELGDISGLSRSEFNARRDELIAKHDGWKEVGVNQIWKFARFKEGDRIVANRGITEVLGIGRVVGSYYFVEGQRHGHRLPVEWYDLTPRRVQKGGWRRTLVALNQEEFEAVCNAPPLENPPYPLDECAKDTGFDESLLERWVRAIERKRQAIVYGPPGTGKTYLAEHLARHLIGGDDGFYKVVQFHPAYAYEDFVQGIRPKARANGQLDYPVVPGRFLEFCEKAKDRQGCCVLIIDEINRANLARVFGELMYLLEYRDREVPLASGGFLRIPANVRIVGTMNTADRSIALVDHALRRRFAFLALYPNFDVLRRYHQGTGFDVEPLISVLHKLNRQIGDRHYQVGITFFLRKDLTEQIEDIWRMEIEPYLEEYFFDQPDKVDEFRWEEVGKKILL